MKVIKGSLTDIVLFALEKAIDGYVRTEDFLYNTHIYARGYERPLKKSNLAKTIKRLREKGLIEEKVGVENLAFKLSTAGESLVRQLYFDEKKWDGVWRLVIFDIPENQRKLRSILRSRLKLWGFIQWQKSVWATKRNIMNELEDIISELKIEKWIIVLESRNVSLKPSQALGTSKHPIGQVDGRD